MFIIHLMTSQVDSSPSPLSHSCPSLPVFSSVHPSLSPITSRQETTLLSHLNWASVAIGYSPRASRLQRKLKIRQRQRNHGYPTFNLDRHIIQSLSRTLKYAVEKEKPYSEQVVPVTQRMTSHPLSHSDTYHTILHHISSFPLLSPSSSTHYTRMTNSLSGRGLNLDPIASPYTSRLLKPYIFRSSDIQPPQVCPIGHLCELS